MGAYFFRGAFLLWLAASNVIVVAQDTKSSVEANSEVDVQETSDETAAQESTESTTSKRESQSKFEPTEEVSEDLSVPFPIDI